jgi:hypothetical protein
MGINSLLGLLGSDNACNITLTEVQPDFAKGQKFQPLDLRALRFIY